ncbi:pyridoxal phosphate phosphatase PHOSPHO2 [Patella vulgata]|uniref:pyridoxal phosphate phosphatase PHOSPHO2 n=1 Tax=Patella vulgata TaxID=6465 RepID=UPI0024A8AEED|nr:pyridoxal phosphate phosphatase PHOSPHO2 [Patella vulgata]XP_050388765.2 pyridoxal phosphate phosphatase PHOSPHO2 [Patella vulgata]
MATDKILLAFDFDHTIIDDNSDIHVIKLAPNGKLPQSIQDQYDDNGWTEYMGTIFKYLFENGINQEDIRTCMHEIRLTDGMEELFEQAKSDRFESIIISDSNSIFIQFILEKLNLCEIFSEVFTNPAVFDEDGCLTIKHYHTQDYCQLSTINLCKGRILQDFIEMRKKEGIVYSHVVYVGDGSNDLCPGLKLENQDFLCPRKGFSLWKKLNKKKNVQPEIKTMKAGVVDWDNGRDIKKLLERL